MSDRGAYREPGEDDLRQAVSDDSRELRRLSSFAGIPAAAAAHTPDPLPDMDTALY